MRRKDTVVNPEIRADLLRYANATPSVLSLLYDLDLMPEQVTAGTPGDHRMLLIIGHWKLAHDIGRMDRPDA